MIPSPDSHDDPSAAEHLVVRVDGGTGDTNYTLMIARPAAGRVHVREWTEANRAGTSRDEMLSVDDVYARLERAYEARRRMNVELGRVREWLGA